MIGSPLYMSPEQAMGRKTIDLRTDVWSLGVVLYEALAGRTPHLEGETFMAVMMAILSKPPPPIQDVAPWVPPEIARIVHRMIAEAPDARFPSMAAVLEAILPSLPAGLSIRATDLVALGGEEQAHRAPRLVLGDEATNAGFEPTQPSDAHPALPATDAPASGTPTVGHQAPPTAVTWAEGGPALARRDAQSPRRRAFTVIPMVLVPLVVGLASVMVYQTRARPAPLVLATGPTASAPTPSASSPTVEPVPPLPPLPELAVRLAIEPRDATVEVDGRVTPVTDGGIELRGALGSAHHVRLVKGSQKAEGEVAITSLGAVPSSMAVEVPTPRRSPVTPLGTSKPIAGPAPAGARETGKNPALNGKFE
jgi:serine/threonine-protein kinase